jgi:uncharacterized protein
MMEQETSYAMTETTSQLAATAEPIRYSRQFPPFQPAFGLRGPHAQTLLGVYAASSVQPYRAVTYRYTMPDGDELVLHDDQPSTWQVGQRVILLVHGLTGSHLSPYMVRMTTKFNALGYRVFRLDLRGCGAGLALARRPYHCGRSEDVHAAVLEISRLTDDSPLTVVGFSLGGNITVKLLGELAGDSCGGLDSGVAICPPLDLLQSSDILQRFPNCLYDRHFTKQLKRSVSELQQLRTDLPQIELPARVRNIRQFDDHYTAPASGFENALDYYAQTSGRHFISHVQHPLLVIAALDDPLIPGQVYDEITPAAAVDLYLTKHGGHMGYYARHGIDPDRRWMDWRIVDWVRALVRR